MAVARLEKTGRKSRGPSQHDTTEAAPAAAEPLVYTVGEAGSSRRCSGYRTSNPPQTTASKMASHVTGTMRVRPVTKLRTIDEVAEILGTSSRTIQRFAASGALPVHRLGRLVRISDADIAAFLAANRSV